MGLNETPSGERLHIGFFGRRNAGKSSLINAVTGQNIAVVSDVKGTTTDPVYKAMELLPIGPVMLIDTPGYDDDGGKLGEMRVQKTKQVLNKTDIALLVVSAEDGLGECERELQDLFAKKQIPYLTVYSKCELAAQLPETDATSICVSAETGKNIFELKEAIAKLVPSEENAPKLVGDLIAPGDFVVLVVPIDSAAPKGRLILPQQQAIRDVLDSDATAIVVKDTDLRATLESLGKKPSLVITDSQAFGKVAKDTPKDIPLTSFSILMARRKGYLDTAVKGVAAIDSLKDGDTVLISEGCTHHRQCDDIGTVKIPRWLKEYTGKELNIETSSGTGFPEDLSKYALVIHCGGCMLNEREVRYRMKCAEDQGTHFTNYGITIAYLKGILRRSIEVFPALVAELDGKQ